MLEGIKPYPRYKNTEVPWLCDVPEHWRVCRIKNLLQEKNFRTLDGAGILLSLTRTKGLIPYTDRTSKAHSAKTLIGYKVFKSNQIVMNRMQAWSGMFGTAKSNGLVSPDYAVYQSLGGNNPDFLTHRLKSPDLVEQYRIASRGIGSGFNRLYNDKFGAIYISVPPCEEQEAIVKFLHYANGKLDRAIRAKRKTIALLNEQKQAITHRAVTRGLDKSVPLKPSGIPWVGDIPKHWTLSPNRALLRKRKILVGERHSEYNLLSLTKKGVIVRDVDSGKGKFSSDMGTSQIVRNGDLIFCLFDVPETPRTVGRSKFNGMITSAYTVFECPDPVTSSYLELFYIAMDDRKLLSPIYSGLRNTIPPQRFLGIKTPLPPSAEMEEIVKYIIEKTVEIDRGILKLEQELTLLSEYRTRLISDVVTGKMDVREAVKNLPAATMDEPVQEIDEVEDEDLEETA